MESTWTIAELAEQAATTLGQDAAAASGRRVNGRVRDVPNERLIRWYTTIGLVDPPASRRGRTALYGPRHLLQIVAVKRRQAAGRSIAEIQVELAGATDATLSEIARLPEELVRLPEEIGSEELGSEEFDPEKSGREKSGSEVSGREEFVAEVPEARAERPHGARFWTAQPSSPRTVSPAEVDGTRPTLVQGVRIAPGVTVLLDTAPGSLTGDDLAAIESAARPLLDELRRLGLLDRAVPSEHAPRADVRSAEPPGRSQ